MKGKFITLEGIDGAGKSSHAASLCAMLRAHEREVRLTREPGGTPLGEALRELALNRNMHVETELLLMFAARSQHLHEVIWPALETGAWVVSDRFSDASYAYQGGGGGIAQAKIEALESWLHPGFAPDRTLLFDLPADIARRRARRSRAADRFERQDADYFERVRQRYLQRAKREPDRIRVIDATQPFDIVARQIEHSIADL